MSTITRDRLLKIQQWRETYGPGSNVVLPAEEAEELARIALASLEAEPVADVVAWSHPTEGRTCDIRWRRFDVAPGLLYTDPPAPVSVPDEVTAEDCPAFVKYDITEVDEAWARGFNACRAAMQGAEPVTTAYKLPDGWVLVPNEPTDAMVEAMYNHPISMRGALKSAIAAAPQQEVK